MKNSNRKSKEKIDNLINIKKSSERRISALTSYDYPTAKLCDESGVDIILVGDSLGMVVLGFENTTFVNMDHMLHHLKACRRGVKSSLLVADLPFGSCDNPNLAVENSKRLIDAGADAVKLEGGLSKKDEILAIRNENINLMGHIGMLPQNIEIDGGYKRKGKNKAELDSLCEDATFLQESGVFSVVLEGINSKSASYIADKVDIITIGIGSGEKTCDGEIAVIHDILGAYPWFVPPFAKTYVNIAEETKKAISLYLKDIN